MQRCATRQSCVKQCHMQSLIRRRGRHSPRQGVARVISCTCTLRRIQNATILCCCGASQRDGSARCGFGCSAQASCTEPEVCLLHRNATAHASCVEPDAGLLHLHAAVLANAALWRTTCWIVRCWGCRGIAVQYVLPCSRAHLVQAVLLEESDPVVKNAAALGLVERGGVAGVVIDGGGAAAQADAPLLLLHAQVEVLVLAQPARNMSAGEKHGRVIKG